MELILSLCQAGAVPALLSIILYICKKKTFYGKLSVWPRQIIAGILFGLAAVAATEVFGVDVGGATANARDAAPICAGLLFGGPAGIIAGVIGGVERWFSLAGDYSRIACSVATVLSGFYASFLRRHVFDDRRPRPIFSAVTAIVMEVIHMIILLLTHLGDEEEALRILKIVSVPMIAVNCAAVFFAAVTIEIIGRTVAHKKKRSVMIATRIQQWLLLIVTVIFLLTTAFVYELQTSTQEQMADKQIEINIEDIQNEIKTLSAQHFNKMVNDIRNEINENPDVVLSEMLERYNVSQIDIIDSRGKVLDSSNRNTKNQSADVTKEQGAVIIDDDVAKDEDSEQMVVVKKSATASLIKGYVLRVSISAEQYQKDLEETVYGLTTNRHVGSTGFIIIADEDMEIVSNQILHEGSNLKEIGIDLKTVESGVRIVSAVYGEESHWMFQTCEGYFIIGVMPTSEIFDARDSSNLINSFIQVLLFAIFFISCYFLVKKEVVNNLRSVNKSLSIICSGDLNETVRVRSTEEFASLSDDINKTVSTLKTYIAEASARLDQELQFAKNIQHSALPSLTPSITSRPEFLLNATMDTAKEVGGDFYDYYMLGENHLAFLIADVSGKGIPAAMFMMKAKTMIRNFVETGMPLNEAFTRANAELCEGNEAEMFVTAFMGVLDLQTGHITFVNAGHNPPLIYRKGEGVSYLKSRAGLVLAGMDGFKYRLQELDLNEDDKLFLYTDGVTEATNIRVEQYGEERLQAYLQENCEKEPSDILSGVKQNLDAFVGEAEQFDDITMLALHYIGKTDNHLEEREYEATDENLEPAQDFVTEKMESVGCSMKIVTQVMIAFEEMFVNVAHYAYPGTTGKVRVGVNVTEERLIIRLKDSGIPFDPLKREDPNIQATAEQRNIGGLGIFMVKKTMDDVSYEYENGCNILTFVKKLK